MYKWVISGCPRCHGDLYLDAREQYAEYICLQCGYRKTAKPVETIRMSDRYGKVKQGGRRYD
jgi:DNA-directed RNA polymerase subunit M/transcription elongation factor TFIIS